MSGAHISTVPVGLAGIREDLQAVQSRTADVVRSRSLAGREDVRAAVEQAELLAHRAEIEVRRAQRLLLDVP